MGCLVERLLKVRRTNKQKDKGSQGRGNSSCQSEALFGEDMRHTTTKDAHDKQAETHGDVNHHGEVGNCHTVCLNRR